MKTKKFNKKFDLKKHTVSNLNQEEMNDLKGGTTGITVTCTAGKICTGIIIAAISVDDSCYDWCPRTITV